MKARPVTALTPKEFARYPVWEYDNGNEGKPGRDETWVVPVKRLPVDDLGGRVVSALLVLKNGQKFPGSLGNVALTNARQNREFLIVSIWHQDRWFNLARYFDFAIAERGPLALAALLGLPLEEVFPIGYDISESATGLAEVVRGEIVVEPSVRLSGAERMKLIFER